MKKIIFEKLYDTSTAEKIGSRSYDCHEGFGCVEETLYRKNSGELFLHVKGNPDICYDHQMPYAEWLGGEAIICEPYFFAEEWVAENLDADIFLKLFDTVRE